MGRTPANLALAAVVTILCFVAGELALRQLPLADRMGWNRLPPAAERAAVGPKVPGTLRLLGIGDSFTAWGEASGDNFLHVAGRILDAEGQRVDVVNLGEPGAGLADYHRVVRRHAEALAPDITVIGLYLGNDATALGLGRLQQRDADGSILRDPPAPGGEPVKQFLKHSLALNYAWRLLKARLPALRSGILDHTVEYLRQENGIPPAVIADRLARVDPDMLDAARADMVNPWDIAMGVVFPDYYGDLARADRATPAGRSIDGFLADLDFALSDWRTRGLNPILVLFPPPAWVDARTHEYFRRAGYRDLGPTAGEPAVVAEVKAFLAARAVPTLDLLPALRGSDRPLFIDRDIHLNRDGHRAAGEALARFLAVEGPGGG